MYKRQSLEYVKQYRGSHSNLNANQGYLLEQCVVWQRLSEYLGWQCDKVRAAYSEISQDIQNEVYAGARAFVQANKGRYKCGGYILSLIHISKHRNIRMITEI